MYNDKNVQFDRRRAMVRQTYAAPASADYGDMARIPSVEEETGGRRCDGTMPRQNTQSGNRKSGWGLREFPLAMVYSPYQEWRDLYTPEIGLSRGTLFAELDLPFEGYKRNGGC